MYLLFNIEEILLLPTKCISVFLTIQGVNSFTSVQIWPACLSCVTS